MTEPYELALLVEERADRVVVTLNRPDRRNAIDMQFVEELHEVCGRLERDPRLLLITGGSDGVFAGGADIAQLRDRGRIEALAAINIGVFERLRRLPMPTIAAIDGAAPKRVTIQVFDSFDQAKDYRNGPAWKAILELQKKATKTRSYVVEGL